MRFLVPGHCSPACQGQHLPTCVQSFWWDVLVWLPVVEQKEG